MTWDQKKEEEFISGYRMFYREEGQKYNYKKPAWEGSATTCIFSNLDSNKKYYFVVRVFNRMGIESDNSNEAKYEPTQNIPPKAFDQLITIKENSSSNITLTAVDYDDEHISYIVINQPLYGTLSGPPPTLTYTPDTNYNSYDNFTFKVNDGKADSNIATIRIFLNSINLAAIENEGQDQKDEFDEDTNNVTQNTDTDEEKDSLLNELELNNAPSAPALNYPANNSEIDTFEIFLSVSNSKDPEEQSLTYTFEIYSDQGLNSLLSSISGIQEEENTTSWRVDTLLEDNSFYYWRARAFDGIVYSEWIDTASFFVNTSNDPPSIPSITSPPNNSEVWTLQPALQVNNASDIDLDPLKYVFEVYLDQYMNDLQYTKTVLVEGSNGTTAWQINTQLEDNTLYWWRVQAKDNENEVSDWTNLSQFFVNTSNDVPSIPTINKPINTQEVDTLFPVLQITNSKDVDLIQEKLTYFFEIDKSNTFDTSSLEKSPQIPEGENLTSWAPSQLEDNSFYYWRARAYDGAAYSLWANGFFFVNLFNDPPDTPTIKNPGKNTKVSTSTPKLIVNPSKDADFDQIDYEFELYSDSNMSNLLSVIKINETSCKVDVTLENNRIYFWRARAVDDHGAFSDWSDIMSFWVNVTYRPTVPTINNPVSGGIVTSLTPTLSVNNSNDQDNEILYYKFELFLDKDLSYKIASSTIIFQKNIITSWHISYPLLDNTTYYWRVRATDGKLTSQWMPTAMFFVDTSGAEIMMDLESSQDVLATDPNAQIIEVTNDESPINTVLLEIPPGALSNDCTITIGLITNPPALPDNTKAIGKVIEFGPSGITFSQKISIMIPYSQEDLDNAGVSDPLQLEVFTYNATTLLWERIIVDEVDMVNSLLIYKTYHFSMFTTGISIETSELDDNAEHLEFGGNCFIESLYSK